MNITALFRDYNIAASDQSSENASPEFLQTKCVFCDDPLDHLGWHLSGEFVNCWKCGGHSIEYALQKLLNLTRVQVNELVEKYSGMGGQDVRARLNARKVPRAITVELPGHPLDKQHVRYLKRRGFDPEYLERKYGLRGTGIAEEWKYRIIIPIYFNGKLVSFQGRDITDRQKLRYRSLEVERSVMHYKHTLYNMDNCDRNTVVVFEGPTDVWRWGDGSVATYSTAITEWQIRLLAGYRKVFFIFDSEPEAQLLAKRAAFKLSIMGVSVEVIDLESDKDPGELDESEVHDLKKGLGV